MAKKKDKQAATKKKLTALLAKVEKKKSQIERRRKQLKALEGRMAKLIAQNPKLKPVATDAPKTASRRRKAAS